MNFLETLYLICEQEHMRLLYILTILCVAMVIDFVTGVIAAKINGCFKSSIGINGILRKVASIVVLILCAFLVPLIPGSTGIIALDVLYIGYLIMEMASILENLNCSGINIGPFKVFIDNLNKKGDK